MAQRIQLRRDTAAAWTLANPTLAEGEFAVNTDTLQVKVGDGTTAWASLAYLEGVGGGGDPFPDFAGVALLGRSEDGVTGPVETLVPATVQSMLGYALYSSADIDDVTLSTVGTAVDDHVAYDGDDGGTVHGLRPPVVLQANLITQRYQLYENETTPVTSVVGGFAPSGEVEVWAIHTGANKGLYYRDEDTTAQRLAPLTEYTPELGYAERTTNHVSTNTTAATNDVISGLSVTVVGRGRPVQVEVSCASARHSVASNWVIIGLIIDGVLSKTAITISPSANIGPSSYISYRMILVDAQSYTFGVGVQAQAATATLIGSAAAPMHLAVTER